MARNTKTLLGAKARKAVKDGVDAIYLPVARTLGPEGKNALVYRTYNRGPRITNDGYTVAEVQSPKDPFIRMAAEAFRESCKRTNEKAGDGTTTTATIGGRLFNDGYTLLTEGRSEFIENRNGNVGVMSLRRNILTSAEKVKSAILSHAKKTQTIEDLEKIATISVEDPVLGKTIANMAWQCGVDGYIDVVEGYKGQIETEIIKGMRFPAKVAAKAFVNNPARYEMVATDCPVFITNYALDNASEVAQIFQQFSKVTSKIIVIAPSFSENVLVNMANATKQGYFFYPILAPALRTEQLEDIAIYCGATLFDKNKSKHIRTATTNDLGFIEKIIVKDTENKEDAVVTGGRGTMDTIVSDVSEIETEKNGKKKKEKIITDRTSTLIQERIDLLKGQLAETKQEQFKMVIERRIASMASAVGIIKVGDSTQANSLYRKLKIEDAVYACKAALRGGYVKGGGLCLKEIADTLPEDDILKSAISEPYERIQSSVDGGVEITDDIIDPAEAVYYAVDHATSVVANLLTVEIITPELEDEQQDGEKAIARSIFEVSIALKRHLGILKESEEDAERDHNEQFENVLLTDHD